MEGIRPVNDMYRKVADYRTYRLLNASSRYEKMTAKSIGKLLKNIRVQMRNLIFNGRDLISILSFLEKFKFAYEAKDVHESAAMWLFHYFMEGRSQRSLLAKMSNPSDTKRTYGECLKS